VECSQIILNRSAGPSHDVGLAGVKVIFKKSPTDREVRNPRAKGRFGLTPRAGLAEVDIRNDAFLALAQSRE
jgi:hypothetical protein